MTILGLQLVRMCEAMCCVQVDEHEVVVDSQTGKVLCADAGLCEKVSRSVERMRQAIAPCIVPG